MAKNKNNPLVTELRRLLRKHPDTETMEILVPDILGILRGKRVLSLRNLIKLSLALKTDISKLTS